MEEAKKIYNALIDNENFTEWDIDKCLSAIGTLVDISCDLLKIDGLKHAIKQANLVLVEKNLNEQHETILYYFIGNAWSGLRVLKTSDAESAWRWEQDEIENEILNLRLFNRNIKVDSKNPYFCHANTNLGNALSHVGRFVEANMYWGEVIQYDSTFGMALANKGYGLISYAKSLYDDGHSRVFLKCAYSLLKQGLESNDIHTGASEVFISAMRDIESWVSMEYLKGSFEMDDYSLGDSDDEKQYRVWCLNNTLFLNPLNDLGSYNIAAQDIISCPSLYTGKEDTSHYPPAYFGFYNQLKQEYVSARFLSYESLQNFAPHYSDSNVQLYNTLDYPCYGLNTEKVKVAFRMSYSIFDKIAYFLNNYLRLKIPETQVSFRTIWYEKQSKHKGIRKEFTCFENWPFRGLFWLAKDFSEHRSEFRKSIEPEAQDFANIRNHLEHKFLTITEFDSIEPDELIDKTHKKVYRITEGFFFSKTLKLLKLTRAALIYLSLGVNIEERKKQSKTDGLIMPMYLDNWEDDWKK